MNVYRCFDVFRDADAVVLKIGGESQAEPDAARPVQELLDLVAREAPQCLVVRLAAATYCSSGFINALLLVQQAMMKRHGVLTICGATRLNREKFRSLHLDGTVFQIVETEEEAIASCQQRLTSGAP